MRWVEVDGAGWSWVEVDGAGCNISSSLNIPSLSLPHLLQIVGRTQDFSILFTFKVVYFLD